MIELRHISKIYQQQAHVFHALEDINLSISRGQIVGIVGESGAGKSTLLRTINLLERPSHGQVYIADKDLMRLNPAALRTERRKIGMIFQHFNLLTSRTVFENIALPLELSGTPKATIDNVVGELLALVNLSDRAHYYPNQLSGGQKQRTAIARALTTKPDILLCDEATSALDPSSKYAILNLLKTINQELNVTIVLITHEMDVVKHSCSHVGVLHQGKLIEYADVLELFARPKSPVTRQLVQKSLHIALPARIKTKLQAHHDPSKSRLVRFTFVGDESGQPLIMDLVKRFNILINILQANIETIHDAPIGFTVCQLTGEHSEIDRALGSISPSAVTVEVLGYV